MGFAPATPDSKITHSLLREGRDGFQGVLGPVEGVCQLFDLLRG